MIREETMEIITNALQSDESNYTEKIDKALALVQKALEQEPILDKIRAEISEEKIEHDLDIGNETLYNKAIDDCLKIIDKYRQEG